MRHKLQNKVKVDKMPMMKHLNKLWENNELDDNVSAWFKTPKPIEVPLCLNKFISTNLDAGIERP